MSLASWIRAAEAIQGKAVRLALRWILILATALLVFPAGGGAPRALDLGLILILALSNFALSFIPERAVLSRRVETIVLIADTLVVSLALFHSGPRADLPLGFFLILVMAALGADLPRIMIGATLLAIGYLALAPRAPGESLAAVLMRLPFLFTAALYYGNLLCRARLDQERDRRLERERDELLTFVEVTSATTSTLDLKEVLFLIVGRIARLVGARRCSIVSVDEGGTRLEVLASNDDRNAAGLALDIEKYPEIRRALGTHEAVVIPDIEREPMLKEVHGHLRRLGFDAILVMPILYRDTVLGMLFLRATRQGASFTQGEIAICRVVANASANAIRNATLFDRLAQVARQSRETADKLQNILDHFPDLIYTTDREGRLTEFSRGGQSLLGYTREQALGMAIADMYPDPETRDRLARSTDEAEAAPGFETTVRCRDGSVREVLVAATVLRGDRGEPCGTVGIVKDIADLKATRLHLLQAEKLSAMGQMVSGAAHELNNPLAGVLGYAQLLMRGRMEARQKRAIERIFDAALRCQKIVQNLLSFSRRHPSEKKHLGLNGIIEKTLDLHAYSMRVGNVEVVKRLDPALPKTMLDFHQIQQLLVNLFNNAQYAMTRHRGRGTLTVTTSCREGVARLVVEDDGPGFPPKILERVFDPFFTTKPVGEGTGLGLSVTYGIVKEHGGRIRAERRPGEGARVVVELPILEMADGTPPVTAPRVPGRAAFLDILAVDDEPVILDLIVDAFRQDGHRIDTASSARQAIEKLADRRYDVVVLDLKMPENDGRWLFGEIREHWPEAAGRVIFVSGDTLQPETLAFLQGSGRPWIEKPFRLEDLAAAIAGVTGDEREAAAG